MLGRFLKAILKQPREKPLHEQPFRVVRRSGADYYAIGILPQFLSPSSDLPRVPYHELICKKISASEAAICRTEQVDRELVNEILQCEPDTLYKGIWAEALYGGRFSSIESATHWVEFRYCIRPDSCRHIVAWPFDFGISPHHNSSEVALKICNFLIQTITEDFKGQDMLIPSKNARRFYHTLIQRCLLNALGVLRKG